MANKPVPKGKIQTRVYKSGSIIYFLGDKSEHIYVLKSGRIILSSTRLDSGAEVKEDVRLGEFFGVKSALGKYPREETAQTIGETVVLLFQLADFERLILRNVSVVRKMLRVFSNQLRRVGKMVRSVLGEGDILNPDIELFRIGEYYYKAGVFQHAQYAFKRYMEYYPDGEYSNVALERINAIDSGQAIPGETGFDVDSMSNDNSSEAEPLSDNSFAAEPSGGDSGNDKMFDFDGGDDTPEVSSSTGSGSDLSNEMDDFLSGDDSGDEFDDFASGDDSGDEFGDFLSDSGPDSASNAGLSGMYNEASNKYNEKKYSEALEIYRNIINSSDVQGEENQRIQGNSLYESGMCLMMLKDQKGALETFASVIKKFPNSEKVKGSLFQIGVIFEMINKKDKAKAYFTKVVSMQPEDELSEKASEKINQL